MPTEYRRVVFPNRELREALAASDPGGEPFPPGEIISVAMPEDGEGTVRVTVLDTACNATFTSDLAVSRVAAALIRFCIDNKVPIPKKGRKSLRLMGDNLALDIIIRERNLLELDAVD